MTKIAIRSLTSTIMAFLMLTIFNCRLSYAQPAESLPETAEISSANELMVKFAQAWSQDKTEAVTDLFAENIVLIRGGSVAEGFEAIAGWAKEQMKKSDVLTITPVRSGIHDNLAYQSGRWTMTYEGGASRGSHTFIFKRGPNDEWKIVSMQIENDTVPQADQKTSGQARQAIEKIYAELTQTMENMEEGEAARIAERVYMENAILFAPNTPPAKGQAAIAQVFKGMMEAGLQIEPKVIEVEVFGDAAYERGLAIVRNEAGRVIARQPYMVIWKQVDGRWKVWRDFVKSGSGQAPPEQMKTGQSGHSEAAGNVRQAIQANFEAMQQAYVQGNLAELARHFTEDALFVLPGRPPIEGRKAIRQAHAQMMNHGIAQIYPETRKVEVFGNTAYEIGTYELEAKGGQIIDRGWYATIWKKIDGEWKIHRDVLSSNGPGSKKQQ